MIVLAAGAFGRAACFGGSNFRRFQSRYSIVGLAVKAMKRTEAQ
jgi:hypothetical protein